MIKYVLRFLEVYLLLHVDDTHYVILCLRQYPILFCHIKSKIFKIIDQVYVKFAQKPLQNPSPSQRKLYISLP